MATNTVEIDLLIKTSESVKSIQAQRIALKDLRNALNSVEEGSEAFNKLAAATGNLQDKMADLRATTKFYSDDLKNLSGATDIAEGIAASFGVATVALQAFGLSNDQAQEAIRKLEIAQTALNSINAIGNLIQKESSGNLLLNNLLSKVGISTKIAEAAAVETLTIKQRILNLVQKASPMGILIGLATALFTAYTLLTGKTDEQIAAEKKAEQQKKQLILVEKERLAQQTKAAKYVAEEKSAYFSLAEQLKKTNPGSRERLDLINKINSTYGTTLKNLKDEKSFQDQVNLSIKDYTEFLRLKYSAQSKEDLLNKVFEKNEITRSNIAKKQSEDRKLRLKEDKELAQFNKLQNIVNSGIATEVQKLELEGFDILKSNIDAKRNLRANEIDELKKQSEDEIKRAEGYVNRIQKTQDKINATGLKTQEDNNKAVTNNTVKHYKDLVELRKKLEEDLFNAQKESEKDSIKSNEIYYSEILGNQISYNEEYLKEWKANQDKQIAAEDKIQADKLAADKTALEAEYKSIINQEGIGNAAKIKAKKDFDAAIASLEGIDKINTANRKKITDKDRENQEKNTNEKIRQIKLEAGKQELKVLEDNLALSEDALFNYYEKVSVLSRSSTVLSIEDLKKLDEWRKKINSKTISDSLKAYEIETLQSRLQDKNNRNYSEKIGLDGKSLIILELTKRQIKEVKEFTESQLQSSKDYNRLILERRDKLAEAAKIENPEDKRKKTIEIYKETSNEIAKIVEEDGKQFKKLSTNFLGFENVTTKALADKVNLAAETSAKIQIIEKDLQNKLAEIDGNTTLTDAEKAKQRIDAEAAANKKIEDLTLQSALKRKQIDQSVKNAQKEALNDLSMVASKIFEIYIKIGKLLLRKTQ
jgi:hypothetical protein